MTDIIWEDPEPSRRRGKTSDKMDAFIDALKERPKEWAKWPERKYYGWGRNIVKNHPGLETTARNIAPESEDSKTSLCDTYFRWTE